MAMAVAALVERRVKRIVLCRPAVEAGEKLDSCPATSPRRSALSAAAL